MRWIIGIIIISLVAWFGYGKFNPSTDGKTATPTAIKISVATATKKDVPIVVLLSGNIIAYETVAIKSRLDSQLTAVKFHDGEAIEKGQLLFVLDNRSLKTQLAQNQATLTNAKLQYERAKKLLAGKFIAKASVDDSKAAYDAAQANLDNTLISLSYCEIKSPINGRAGTINVTEGNNVKANDPLPLVTINQVRPIRSQFSIPERYYEQVKSAMSAGIVSVAAIRQESGQITEGKLEYIDNTIDASTGSFVARAVFDNENESLWPGMFVNISLELGSEKSALTIPTVALQGDEGKHFVFKIVDKKAVKTPVEAKNNGKITIITKGLAEGEQVATDGLLKISDGAAVETGENKN